MGVPQNTCSDFLSAQVPFFRPYQAMTCQTAVLLLNLLMIGLVKWPSFQQQLKPALSKVFHKWYYEAATIRAVSG
jgi:hypothetical protein